MNYEKKIKEAQQKIKEFENTFSPEDREEFNQGYQELLHKLEELKKLSVTAPTVTMLRKQLQDLEEKGLGDKPIKSLLRDDYLIVIADDAYGEAVWYYDESIEDMMIQKEE